MKIYTVHSPEGLYLMNAVFLDYTDDFKNALLFQSKEKALDEIGRFGLFSNYIKEYSVSPIEQTLKKEPVKTPCYVYFIPEREGSNVKIGYSKDPIARVKQLQTGHPTKLGLDGYFYYEDEEKARIAESNFHHKFSEYRKTGEWFEYSEEIKQFIISSYYDPTFVKYYI